MAPAIAALITVAPVILKGISKRIGNAKLKRALASIADLVVYAEQSVNGGGEKKFAYVKDKTEDRNVRQEFDLMDDEVIEMINYLAQGAGRSLDPEVMLSVITLVECAFNNGLRSAASTVAWHFGLEPITAVAGAREQSIT